MATHDNNGYVKNRFLDKRLNNANEWAGRVQVLFEPTDSFDVLLNYRRSEQDIDTGFFEHVTANVEGMLTPNEVNEVLGYIDNDGDVYEGDYDRDGHNDLVTEGFSATANWDFDNFTLTSITDYSTVKRDYIEDSDASPVPLFNFYLTTDAEQFSQEVRVSGSTGAMDWVGGIYYLDLSVQDSNGAESEPFIDPASDTPFVSGLDNPYETNTESWSIFGQVERRLNDRLTGILGARWIRDEKDHAYGINVVDFVPGTVQRNGNPNVLAEVANYFGERQDDEVSVRLALNYDLNEDAMIYASWNRGVKGGGYNSPLFPFFTEDLAYDDETMSYDPEQLDALEVGFKARLADGLAILNGAAYYYDYKDYQAFQIVFLDTLTTNADAESYGFELGSAGDARGRARRDSGHGLQRCGSRPRQGALTEDNLGAVAQVEPERPGPLCVDLCRRHPGRPSRCTLPVEAFLLAHRPSDSRGGRLHDHERFAQLHQRQRRLHAHRVRAQPRRCPTPRSDLRPVGPGRVRHGRAVLQQAAVVGREPGDAFLRLL